MTVPPPPGGETLLDGRYRLGQRLGSGGVAEVFRAEDVRLHRPVAVKLFRGTVADQLQRHEDEMQTLAGLDHGSLVTVFDAGTDPASERPYLVMQLVDGPTLADELRAGAMPPQRVAAVGADLAEALAYVHSRGLVHRDVKPANVLLDGTGADARAFLADFGIARIVDSSHLTRTGDVLGTPAYFAPEQVSGEPVGPPADVYALGLVLLECLTGRRAYEGAPMEMAMARLSAQPALPAWLPPTWLTLLSRMTARAAGERPTAAQAATALRRMATGDDRTVVLPPAAVPVAATTVMPAATSALPVPDPVPVAPDPVRRSRARGWWIALAVVVIIVAAVAVVVVLTRTSSSPGDCYPTTPTLTGQQETAMQHLEELTCP